MLECLRDLIDEWEIQNVRYVVWKGADHLDDGFGGNGDIDILIDHGSLLKAREILNAHEYIHVVSQKWLSFDEMEDWIGFDKATGKLVHLQVYSEMILGQKYSNNYVLNFSKLCLDNSLLNDEGIRIQSPELEFFVFLCRLYCKSDLSKKKINRMIQYAKENINQEKLRGLLDATSLDKSEISLICDLVGSSEVSYDDVRRMKSLGTLISSRHLRVISTLEGLWRFVQYYSNKFTHRFFLKKGMPQLGMTIAFVGQDGSGKSTVSNDIVNWLTWKIETKRFYLGSGEHYNSWQRVVIKVIGGFRALYPVRAFLSLSDTLKIARKNYQNIRLSVKYKKKGGIAIFDRFPQSKYPGINDGPKVQTKFGKKMENSFLKPVYRAFFKAEKRYFERTEQYPPDLLIKLILTPEESIRRKPFEDLQLVSKKHSIIKEYDFGCKRILNIDATEDYSRELLEIKTFIWDNLFSLNARQEA